MLKICLALCLIFCSAIASAQDDSIKATIVRFFDGLTELNESKLKESTTADFILLENGEVWNLDTLINRIRPRKQMNFKRVNSFNFINTQQNAEVAWVSYENTADITMNDKQRTVKWLESAVLKKQSGKWRIVLLHSTVINQK